MKLNMGVKNVQGLTLLRSAVTSMNARVSINHFEYTIPHLTTELQVLCFSQETYFLSNFVGCACKDLVVASGYGNCQKKWIGEPICYVELPSSCSDLQPSSYVPGDKWSFEACSQTGMRI